MSDFGVKWCGICGCWDDQNKVDQIDVFEREWWVFVDVLVEID